MVTWSGMRITVLTVVTMVWVMLVWVAEAIGAVMVVVDILLVVRASTGRRLYHLNVVFVLRVMDWC